MVTEGMFGLMLATMTVSVRQPELSGRLSLPSSTTLMLPWAKFTNGAGVGTGVLVYTMLTFGVTVGGYIPRGDTGTGLGVKVGVALGLGVMVGRRVLVGLGVGVKVKVAVGLGVWVLPGA